MHRNEKTIRTTVKKHPRIIAAATIMGVIASAAMILGIKPNISKGNSTN
ncbi:MAG TPA: hypothetical protein VFI73_12385 [Candidatus Nitrosopolaris sp.]|nr:hypothetical protein [Candidatus Nitrosopolaris sp.]